ncbi:hypothetical protein [Bradyrhizobium lupini]|uniref:hypothetical protein n=1 Tax=Rhizobium lupini TaxID=136996 RepID=UPI0034C6BC04
MTTTPTYTTYITYGEPWRYLVDTYGISKERAIELLASEPPAPTNDRERYYQRCVRIIRKAKSEVRSTVAGT